MSDFQRHDSLLSNLWRITGGKALSRWPEEMLHRNPQSLSEGFRHRPTMGSWKQTAQERSTWRGLVNKGAALYEKKSICKAERKHRERKGNTNFMTLTCSTYNRQFRARIGLVSHQRTTQTYSRNIFLYSFSFPIPYSFSIVRDERPGMSAVVIRIYVSDFLSVFIANTHYSQ